MESATKVLNIDLDESGIFSPPSTKGTPERNLLMAILERAILDFVGNDEKEVHAVKDWIFADDDDDGKENDYATESSFSFPWICQQLDLEPGTVAEVIRAMPKRGQRRVAPWYYKKAS